MHSDKSGDDKSLSLDLKEEEDINQSEKNAKERKPEELKEELKKWLMKKYKIKALNGLKIFLEDLIQLMMLLSCVYKDNILSLVFLVAIVLYMSRRKVHTLVRVAFIIGSSMVVHYFMALSNLHSSNNPMRFPAPFDPYPSKEEPNGRFFIPWYLKIDFFRNSTEWCLYFGMGLSSVKL